MFCQSRTVCCIIYDITDLQLFIDTFQFADYEYAYIYHDKDKNKDGSLKVPHYHFYGHRKSPITEQSLKNFSKKCHENLLYENLKSNDGALLRYFLHIDNDDKFKYNESDIISNFDVGSKIHNIQTIDKVDPSIIISMFDNGFSTVDIIRKYPKLIYSVSNLNRYEKLLRFQENSKRISEDLEKLSKTEFERVLNPLTMNQLNVDDLPF